MLKSKQTASVVSKCLTILSQISFKKKCILQEMLRLFVPIQEEKCFQNVRNAYEIQIPGPEQV